MSNRPVRHPQAPGAATAADLAPGALDVFRNRPFLLLWLSQAFTQIGGNMVIYGLTVIILESTRASSAVSLLILTFLGPAVLFSALAGVYVDRVDRRTVLVVTNLLRAACFVAMFAAGTFLPLILLLNIVTSTITVFFGPAESAMIPVLVPRRQLLAANGIFTLTLNGAFALGYALFGPIVVALLGAPALILAVAACYLVAALFCWTLPSAPPVHAAPVGVRSVVGSAEEAMGSGMGQLREGIGYIRANPMISWSLLYLGIAASLVGVLGVVGPGFARDSLGLEAKDFVVVVLPLGFGIVTGVLLINNFGHLLPRRRIIDASLIVLGVLLALLAGAGPIARMLQKVESTAGFSTGGLTSLLGVVVAIALLAGVFYAMVAIPAQTQLQEDIPEAARGRIFGILNMLVSVSSFLPIIIVGPFADVFGTTAVILAIAVMVGGAGVLSIVMRGPLRPHELGVPSPGPADRAAMDPVAIAIHSADSEAGVRRAAAADAAAADADADAGRDDGDERGPHAPAEGPGPG